MQYFDLIAKYKAIADLDNMALASKMNALASKKSIAFQNAFQTVDAFSIAQILEGDEDYEFLPEDHAIFVQIFSELPEFSANEFEITWHAYLEGGE